MMQGQSLTMLAFDPRVRPHDACPQCKGEPSLRSGLPLGCIVELTNMFVNEMDVDR